MKPTLSVFNYAVKNEAEDTVTVNVDGYIVDSPTLEFYQEYWGDETSVSYKSFRDQIPAGVKTINLVVNSGGGHVGDAMAIHDLLIELESKGVTVNREGRGIVASAATYLVIGKNSRLSENCLFMIHEVSGYAYGNVTAMENQVKAMRKFNDMIVNFYANETGLSTTVVSNMMKAETWLTAEEAKAKGFVKNVGPKQNLTNSLKAEQWPFKNTAMFNVYNSFFKPENSSDMDLTKVQEAIENGFKNFMEKLGIKNDAAKADDVKNAIAGLTTSITNALKDANSGAAAPDQDAIKNMVNTLLDEKLKDVPEAFKNHVTESIKGLATADQVKDLVTSQTLTNKMDELKTAIINSIGGKSGDTAGNQKETPRLPNNRFAGKTLWSQPN